MTNIIKIVCPAIPETIYMVALSSLMAFLIGLPLGILLYICKRGGLKENLKIYRFIDSLINILRSLPFVVLMFLLFPLSRLIVGRSIGTSASIVPLTISASPFLARLIEGNLNEIDKGIIEAARSMGSTNWDIIKNVLLSEARPQIVNSLTLTIINLIGQSAVVGLIGGGGLGDIAIRYGYQRNQKDILWVTCIIIILLVQLVQFTGNRVNKAIDKK